MVSDAVKKMREAGRAYFKKKGDSGRGSSGVSTAERKKAQQDQQSKAIERWKRGEISQELASSIVKKISRGGGSGRAADPAKYASAQKAIEKHAAQKAKKAAEEKARAEAKRLAEEKARAEAKRLAATRTQQALRNKQIQNNTQARGKGQGIYSPELNLYAQPDKSGQHLDQTATYRQPTINEQKQIDLAAKRSSISGAVEYFETKVEEGVERGSNVPAVKTAQDKFQETKFFKKIKELDEWEKSKRNYNPVDTSKISASTFTTPEGVKSIFDYGAEQTLKVGELGSNIIKTQYEKTPKVRYIKSEPSGQATGILDIKSYQPKKDFSKTFLGSPSPITRETAKEAISNLYTFSAFAPLMSTGTAQKLESKYVYDSVTKKYIKKSDLQKYLSSPTKRGNVINYNLKYSTKADRVNTLLRNLKNPSDKTAISKVLKEAEKIYGKDFVQEFTKQEFSLPIVTQAPKQIRNIQPVEMKNIAFVESGGVWTENKKFIKPDTTTKKQEKNKIGQDTTETNWQSKKRFQDSLTGLANVTTLTSGAKISQQNKQQLGQNTLMGQDTLSSQKNKKIIKPITTSQLRQKTDSLFNEWIKQQSNKPELKKPKKILKSSSILKQLSRTIEKEPELFKVFGRRFGEDFLIGKTTDLVKAQQKLKSFLKGTLGRSGTITKQGEAISFQKLKLFGAEFRPAKKNKKRIVQKAKFSLGSFGETSEIQYFKKKSKGKRAIKKLSLFG